MLWLKNKYSFSLTYLFTSLLGISVLTALPTVKAQSLAEGIWYKIGIAQPGVYKIDAAFIEKIGLDPSLLSTGKIALYSNGNGFLPQANRDSRPNKLQPVHTFTDPDKASLYFYGQGPTRIFFDTESDSFHHELNPYTDTTYYFLTLAEDQRPTVQKYKPTLSEVAEVLHTFDEYWFYEKDETNLLRSGRAWWGDFLGTRNTLRFELDFPGLLENQSALLKFEAIASAQVPTRFIWEVNHTTIGEKTAGIVSTQRYDLKAQIVQGKHQFTTPNGEKIELQLTYDKSGQSSASAYLDYVSLNLKRILRPYNTPTFYRFRPESQKLYVFENTAEDFILWNITDPLQPRIVEAIDGKLQIPSDPTQAVTLIGFKEESVLTPPSIRKIPNQNIRSQPPPELIIITADEWKDEALRLASFRQNHDHLQVLTVTIEEVYNEFSSGKPDVTAIRDLCRYFYQKGKLRYLLLFGDATFDFRNKNQSDSFQAFRARIPSYQSRESLHPVYTYASDDYFGFLEEEAGEWIEDATGDHIMQIGVGRLPVKNRQEAQLIVNKLIDYSTASSHSPWRKKVVFLADNGDNNIHQQHADQLARDVEDRLLASRLFVDEYPLLSTPNGNRTPQVNRELRRRIEEGSLIINFTGHGDELGWTDEQVLTLGDILHFAGYANMPLLVTATCEFGRYDNPAVVSGAELMLLSPRGAAIAAMTTTRPVFSSTNFTINSAFYKAFKQGHLRLGDLMKETKNNSLAGALNRNFVLLGDPSMKLLFPEQKVAWISAPEQLIPFEKVTLQGAILNQETGTIDVNFDGQATIAVFDAPTPFETLGNVSQPAVYEEYRTKLFEGIVTVTAGVFNVEFMVPDYAGEKPRQAKIIAYAYSTDKLKDASGDLWVERKPMDEVPTVEHNPPNVKAYLNNPSFLDGQTVDPNPVLYVEIEDDTGLLFSDPTGSCEAKAILNDTLELPIVDYLISQPDTYSKASVAMPLYLVQEGNYRIDLKFCDIYGNSRELKLHFRLENAGIFQIHSSVVFPNPFVNRVSYRVEHNRVGEDIEMEFKLYTLTGNLVYSNKETRYNVGAIIEKNLEQVPTPFLTNHSPQIYLYEITLRSLQSMKLGRITGKLIQHQ